MNLPTIYEGLCRGGRFSLLFPGLGQILQARGVGILLILLVPLCYWLYFPVGLALHLASAIDAWRFGRRLRLEIDRTGTRVEGYNC